MISANISWELIWRIIARDVCVLQLRSPDYVLRGVVVGILFQLHIPDN